MDIAIAFIATFIVIMLSIQKGLFLAYPLLVGLAIFILLSLRRGFKLKDTLKMAYNGGKKAVPLIKIFVLIGSIIAVWMGGGTISCIVYYGVTLISPNYFILCAFIVSSMISFILGTSFGTTGTIGMAFMVLARSGHVNESLAAGAIIAGAFFGDRCSPMSSSASLVATITETDLYKNINNMLKTSILPFVISVLVYTYLSLKNPLRISGSAMGSEIARLFNIGWIVLLPAIIVIVLALFKVDVKLAMGLSILAAISIGVWLQHRTILEMLKFAIVGYSMKDDSFLKSVIQGGGVIPMLKASLIVVVSSSYSGIFEGTGMLRDVEAFIEGVSNKCGLFAAVIFTSVIAACFGCSQAIAIILTQQLTKKLYEKRGLDKYVAAVDIENTAVVVSPLVPWNIAGTLPATVLAVGPGFIVYGVYLYMLPLVNLFFGRKFVNGVGQRLQGKNELKGQRYIIK